MSAEYIMAAGNDQVILCERGIRTFETYDPQHAGHFGGSGSQKAVPPASGGGSVPRLRPHAGWWSRWPWPRWRLGPTA